MAPKRFARCLILGLLGAGATLARAEIDPQKLRFEHVLDVGRMTQKGLLQDREGFLWIGTQEGLFKYDGYGVTAYEAGPGGLSHGYIFDLFEDPQQPRYIWIATLGGGLNRYDKETDTFTAYRHDPKNPASLPTDSLTTAIPDRTDPNILWASGAGGLCKFNKQTAACVNYIHDPNNPQSISHPIAYALHDDRTDPNILWIGTLGGGFDRFDKRTGLCAVYRHDPQNPQSLPSPDNIVGSITPDEDDPDVLWLGTWAGGFHKFQKSTQTFTHYVHAPTGPSVGMYDDKRGSLWLGSGMEDQNGLIIFDKRAETFTRYPETPDDPESVRGGGISTIYPDRAGAIWLLTYTGKLDKVDPYGQKFSLYRHSAAPNSLSNDMVTSIIEDRQGTVWLATSNGLNRFDRAAGAFVRYQSAPNDPNSPLPRDYVDGLFEDSSGRFWLTFYGQGDNLCRFDPAQGRTTRCYPAKGDGLNVIVEDPAQPNILWIGTRKQGLAQFDAATETLTYFPPDPANPQITSFDFVDAIVADRNAPVVWTASMYGGGLNRLDKTTGAFTHYVSNPNDPQTIGSNSITALYQDRAGRLWIGAKGGGLNLLDPQTNAVTRYGKAAGIAADVMSILEDERGMLWLGATTGLMQFEPQAGKTIRVYTRNDGLQDGVFNQGCAWKTRRGELWFGGVKGANSFAPEQLRDNPFVPPIVLTSLKQGGEPMKTGKQPMFLDNIALGWQQNFFEFEFAALNFTRPEQNRYQYKLEGFDAEWFDSGARRYGRYTNLPAGAYTLRVKGSNNDGVWNETGASLRVFVAAPFWKMWWFYLLAGGNVAGVIGFIARANFEARVNRLKAAQEAALHAAAEREKEAADAANRAKSQFLSSMSHELRTPLNGILGYADILRQAGGLTDLQSDGLRIIKESGEHLLTLINDILDLAKIEAGKLEVIPAEFLLDPFLRGIGGIIRMRAEQKNVLFAYEALTPLPPAIRADEKRLRQILLNLLGNAVKFTDDGYVTLHVSVDQERDLPDGTKEARLLFEVTDTGVGIAPDQLERIFAPFEQTGEARRRAEGTGLGLSISRKLVEAMGGSLCVRSALGQGSAFSFDITAPILQNVMETPRAAERKIIGYSGEKRRILIADDKPYNRQMLAQLLKPLGFEVVSVTNGLELVEKARECHPDAIISDMLMPVKTGFEAVHELRQLPEFQATPMIAISASVFDQPAQQNMLAGCNAFLLKPVRSTALFEVLAAHLSVQWVYQAENAPEAQAASASEAAAQMILPPPEILAELRYFAQRGSMQKLRQRAAELAQQDEKFRPFSEKLQRLAQNYAEDDIRDLLG